MVHHSLILRVRYQLKNHSDTKTKNNFQRFFKEKVLFYGVQSALVTKIAKDIFRDIRIFPKTTVYQLCEELFKSGYCEESWIAANWAYWYDQFESKDIHIYERWVNRYIDNWAECDTFCNHTMGSFLEKYPQYLKTLKTWATSKNLWLRRASAVSLIIPARRGKFLNDIFHIADILLQDSEDMVQKGYGWMLKEASRTHEKEVFGYVVKHKSMMPRTALRYAIEKMPQNLRKKAMEK